MELKEPTVPPRSWPVAALLLALVAVAVIRSAAGTRLDSFTIDEPWHVVAGVSYVRYGDFALNPEHPPLLKLWTGAWMREDFRVPPTPPLREKGSEREWTADTMYRDNDDRAAQVRVRRSAWVFHGILLFALALLLRRAFGTPWAAASVAFLAIEPTVGAHLPLAMTDLAVAVTLAIAAVCLGLLLATWSWAWSLALGFAIGLALGSKHSALPGLAGLALFAIGAWAWRIARRDARTSLVQGAKLAAAGLLGVALLWALYGSRFHARPDGSDGFNRPMAAKIDDLRIPAWRKAIHGADRFRLVPRAYLWGLADTVRAGIETRGNASSVVWGRTIEGRAPWYTWPSLVASKVPLALLAMSALGFLALWRVKLPLAAGWSLSAVLAMAAAHAAALLTANRAYGGVRHALPLVLAMAVVAGALAWRAWTAGRPVWRGLALAPLLIALAMTFREPRLWEYHNEVAGGSEGAYRQFDNEGLDLGQRFHEVRAYYDRVIAPTGLPLNYRGNWSPAQARAARLDIPREPKTLDDEETAGTREGWYVIPVRLHRPRRDWNPDVEFAGLTPMARFGFVEIWRGRQAVGTALRARRLFSRVSRYVYQQGGGDWPLVARRTQEILALQPFHVGAGVELGNAHLRMGHRAEARAAYQALLDQTIRPVDALTSASLVRQIASIDAVTDLSLVAPLRHSWME